VHLVLLGIHLFVVALEPEFDQLKLRVGRLHLGVAPDQLEVLGDLFFPVVTEDPDAGDADVLGEVVVVVFDVLQDDPALRPGPALVGVVHGHLHVPHVGGGARKAESRHGLLG
jgi:hypothetical protein